MQLTNRVINVFFGLLALIGLFMPIFSYDTSYLGGAIDGASGQYNLVELIKMAFGSGSGTINGSALIEAIKANGYTLAMVVTVAGFILGILGLVACIVLGILKSGYAVKLIAAGAGFAGFLAALISLRSITGAILDGTIPFKDLLSSSFSSIISTLVSINSIGVDAGYWLTLVSMGFLAVLNLLWFIFRKKFNEMDGIGQKKTKKSLKRI